MQSRSGGGLPTSEKTSPPPVTQRPRSKAPTPRSMAVSLAADEARDGLAPAASRSADSINKTLLFSSSVPPHCQPRRIWRSIGIVIGPSFLITRTRACVLRQVPPPLVFPPVTASDRILRAPLITGNWQEGKVEGQGLGKRTLHAPKHRQKSPRQVWPSKKRYLVWNKSFPPLLRFPRVWQRGSTLRSDRRCGMALAASHVSEMATDCWSQRAYSAICNEALELLRSCGKL